MALKNQVRVVATFVMMEVRKFVAVRLSVVVWNFARCKLMTHGMQLVLPFLDKVCPYLIEKGLTFVLGKIASDAYNFLHVNGLKNKITHFFNQRMICHQPAEVIVV